MPISLQELVEEIDPKNTVLIFGSGASVPSGAPSVKKLIDGIATQFGIEAGDLTLAEITGLLKERKIDGI